MNIESLLQRSAILLLIASADASAQDTAQISITGGVAAPTCYITTEDVKFEHELSDFQGVGTEQDWVNFNIISAGCDPGANGTLKIAITGDPDQDDRRLFAVTGGTGVGIEVRSHDDRPSFPDGSNPISWAPVGAGGAYRYKARLTQTQEGVTPGVVIATGTVVLSLD